MKPFLIFLFVTCTLAAQDIPKEPRQFQRMEITLEKQEGNLWKVVDPGFVFEKDDHVRFRFRANFDGFLYVMDYGTSGGYSLLFPRDETGQNNKITAGTEYKIPATQAWFRIAGPPGHDIVYWMVTPLALSEGKEGFFPPPMPGSKQPPKTLLPRCDDAIFRARGECIDSGAGLRGISNAEELPENLKKVPRMNSRELVIMRREESSMISSAVPLTGPVIYQFRLAHK
jgi:hypothetical protein